MNTYEVLEMLPAAYVCAWVMGLVVRLFVHAMSKLTRLSAF